MRQPDRSAEVVRDQILSLLGDVLAKRNLVAFAVEEVESLSIGDAREWDSYAWSLCAEKSLYFLRILKYSLENVAKEDLDQIHYILHLSGAEFRLDMPVLHEVAVCSALVSEAGTEVVHPLVGTGGSFKVEDSALGREQCLARFQIGDVNRRIRLVEYGGGDQWCAYLNEFMDLGTLMHCRKTPRPKGFRR